MSQRLYVDQQRPSQGREWSVGVWWENVRREGEDEGEDDDDDGDDDDCDNYDEEEGEEERE